MPDLTPADIDIFTGVDSPLTDGQVAAALGVVRAWCRWHVAPSRTETITADGSGGCEMALPTQRISDVSDIRIGGMSDPSVEWWANGTLRRAGGFADRPRLVEVDLTHGHDMDEKLVAAVASIANRITSATGGAGVDPRVEEKAIGSFRVRWTAQSTAQVDLTMAERIMLEDYRIPLL